jgi:transposase
MKANEMQMREALAATTATWGEIHGVGTVLAAELLGHIGNVSRFPSSEHFASDVGAAPLPASSGERIRHRRGHH